MTAHERSRPPIPTMRWPAAWSSRPSSAWLQELPGRRSRVRPLLTATLAGLPASAVVLDVGGGTGYPLALLASLDRPETARTYVLADPQRGMLLHPRTRHALGNFPELCRVQADGVALPFPDACCDLLLSFGVLCCTSPDAVLRSIAELRRVLRPSGQLAFAVPRRHLQGLERAVLSAGFDVTERFGRNRILFAKG